MDNPRTVRPVMSSSISVGLLSLANLGAPARVPVLAPGHKSGDHTMMACEVALRLGVSEKYAQRLCREGVIRAHRHGREFRVFESDFVAYQEFLKASSRGIPNAKRRTSSRNSRLKGGTA